MGNATGITNIRGAWTDGDLSFQNSSGEDILTVAEESVTFAKGFNLGSYAAIATSDGLTTGAIPEGAALVSVTSAGANNIITLPAPVVGKRIELVVGANGYELRSSTPASIGIGGGTGATAESAIPANSIAVVTCISATSWLGYTITGATLAALEAAA